MVANRTTNNVMMTTSTNTCMFADGNHKQNCPLTIQERRQIAIDKRMCFRCGGFRHNSKDCDRRFKCDICNKNHITQSTPTITGSKVVSLSIPICDGSNEHLKFRINDKINTLRFDCVNHEQQLLIRQQNIPFYDEPKMVDILIGFDNINKIQLTVFGLSRNLNGVLSSCKNIGNEIGPEHNVDKESKLIMNKVMTNYCKTEDVKYDDLEQTIFNQSTVYYQRKIDPNVNEIKEVMNHMLMQMNVDRRKQYRSMMNDMETKEVIEPTKIAPNISYRIPHFVISRDDEKQPWNKAIFKEIILWDIVRPLSVSLHETNRAKSIEGMIRPKHLILYSNVTNNVKRSERNINQFQCPVAVRLYTINRK
ncbi:hypothetical protein DERF_009140 [Dermatophagoides farinae]|uniref:CCHC-type domain-containing protein n=1 Tax=Dermatophagoides farinae TaxID=6954 RepID=A0A922L291_DERFA|nr:hypothetical protein DERF_009140 [Dermatophagoides farinae]